LLIWRDSFFVLDLGLDVLDGIGRLDFQSDGFSGQSFHENLHTTSESEDQVQSRLFLDVVVGQSSAVFELLSSENQSLLIWRDTFFVLDFGLYVLDGVGRLNLEGDGFSGESFNKNLHTSSESENQVKSWFFLNVVVTQSSAIFKLFTSKDQSLLIWRNSFFVLDLGFDIFDGVGWLDFQSDRFSGQGLDKNLHTSSESENQMKGWFFLDIVVGQSSAVFELFASKNESLLIWRDAFLVLDFRFDVFDSVGGFDFEGNGFPSEGFHENLHFWLLAWLFSSVLAVCTTFVYKR